MADPSPGPSVAAPDWLFFGAVWLAVVLVAIKAAYLATHIGFAPSEIGFWLRSLTAISHADLVFVVALWLCGRALVAVAGGRRWIAWGVLAIWTIGAAAAIVYAVASAIAFGSLGGFLTYALLRQVGNVRMLSSSVTAYLTTPVVLALIAVPAGYLFAVAATATRSARSFDRRGLRSTIACVLLAVWIGVGHYAYATDWVRHYDWRIADNAPWVLAVSWWCVADTERAARLVDTFSPDQLRDFEPIGQRTKPTIVIGRRAGRPPRPPRPPNVILIVLESVAERWTSFGGLYDTTPNLLAEASHGLVFQNVYAHIGRSSNSLASLLLSVYPKLGFRDFTEEYPRVERTSLATLFHDHGYRTAFMTPSDMGWAGWQAFLPARGFEEVRDQHALSCSPPVSSWGVEDRCLAEGLNEFIARDPAHPFFAMGWTQQTHHPYEPSPGVPLVDLIQARPSGPDAYDLNRYLNVLHETDHQVERVFAALRETGLANDTVVAIVGDHGQAFGYPHDSYLQGRTAYEEDVHVPLLIWFPRRYQMPEQSVVVGGHVDVAPTLAELAGLPPAPDWQGRSLFDAQHPPRAYFYVAQDEFKLGVREASWKYILDLRAGTDELYDLDSDPTEQHNVAAANRDRCTRLRQRLAAWAEANRRQYERLPS